VANDLLGKLGEAFVLLRADGSTLNADLKKQKKDLEKELSSWESSFKSIGKGLSVAVTPAILAMGAAAIKAGADLDDALDTIRIKTGESGEAAKGLEESFKKVFSNVPSSAQEVADALSVIHQKTGLTGEGLETLTEKTLTFARITKTDLNTVLESSQNLFANWGVAAKDQGASLDFLFNVSQKTGVGIDQLMGSLTGAGATLREFGFSIEESAALLGQLEKAGIDSEAMLGGLRKAASSFAKEGVDLKTGLQATVEEIKSLGPGLASTQKALDVFGNKVGTQVADAILKGKLGVKDFYDQLKNSPDTITKAAGETDGFSEKLKVFQNNVTLALEPLGTKLIDIGNKAMPVLIGLAKAAGGAADGFSNLPEPVQNVAIGLGGIAAAAGPVIYVASTILGHVASLATIFSKWQAAILSTTAAMTALTAVVVGASLYKVVEAFSLINDLQNQQAQAAKDSSYAAQQGQQAIQIAMEKTGIKTQSVVEAFQILKVYSAGLRGETVQLSDAWFDVGEVWKKGADAAAKNKQALSDQKTEQEKAAKAAQNEAQRQRDAAAAKAEATERAKTLREELKKLTDQYSGKTIVEEANKLLTVIKNVGGMTKLTKDEAAQMFPVFEQALTKLAQTGQSIPPALKDAYQALFRLVKLPDMQKTSMESWEKSWREGLEKQTQALQEHQQKRNELIVKGFDSAQELTDKAARLTMSEQEKMVADAGKFRDDALKEIEPLKTSFPEIWAQARDAINGIYDGMVSDAEAASGKAAAAFGKKLGGAIVGAFQQGGGGKQIGGSIGSFLGNEIGSTVGEKVGPMLGKALSGALGKGVGSAIGAAAGSIIPVVGTILGGLAGKFIGGLFGGGEKKKVQEARDEMIKNAGGIDALKARADAAGVSLDKLMSTKKMKDFNAELDKLNKSFGDYEKKVKGIQTAIAGVNTLAQGLAAQLARVVTEQDKVFDEKDKGQKVDDLTKRVYQGTEEQRAAWERLGKFTLATFAEQVRLSGDIIGTLQQMAPAFDVLVDAQQKFGFAGSEATERLIGMYKTVKDNSDVFTSLSGVSQIMRGLGDAMKVNGDLALAFGQELAANFQTLTDRGVDTTMALALMQPQLQQLWELQKEGKLVTDEATQSMLDQAEAQGLVGEQMKDVNEKILDVLLAIGEALGATIPESTRKFAKAVGDIEVPTIDIPYRYRQEGEGPPSSGGGGGEPPPELDKGGLGNWGMGSLAVLHGPEAVIPLDRLESMMSSSQQAMDPRALADAMVAAGIGKGDLVLAPTFQGMLANEARAFMRDQWLPMMISVLQDSGELRNRVGTVVAPAQGAV